METVDTVIVGGGQSGLAMSRCLMDRNVSNVVLERGRLVERWRSQRWDNLRLLTPNWMTRLPGNYKYNGDDMDGFMTAQEAVKLFEDYAASFNAPVLTETEVVEAERTKDGKIRIQTNEGGEFLARNLVIATGFCDKPRRPSFGKDIPPHVVQIDAAMFKHASQLPPGNVLIVGASASGCQIAEELLDYNDENDTDPEYFGEITISVGKHLRLPRSYRGKDIVHWLDAIGFFKSPGRQEEERGSPGPQLIGTPDHRDLDLGILQNRGLRLVGRAIGLKESHGLKVIEFEDDLQNQLSNADNKMLSVLRSIDKFIESNDEIDAPPACELPPVSCPNSPLLEICLSTGYQTVVWATGYRREYNWLKTSLPSLLDENGEVRHDNGVTPLEGVYILGMRFLRTKSSSFIDGVAADAEYLANQIVQRNSTLDKA